MRLTITRTIAAPRSRVFDVFTDLQNAADRLSSIDAIELITPGPARAGTRWRETRTMFKQSSTEELSITAFDPGQSYTVEAQTCGCLFQTTFNFTDGDSPNTTRVEQITATQSITLLAKLMSPLGFLAVGGTKKMMEHDMDDLAKVCEQDSA